MGYGSEAVAVMGVLGVRKVWDVFLTELSNWFRWRLDIVNYRRGFWSGDNVCLHSYSIFLKCFHAI